MCILSNSPIGASFEHKLSERFFGNPGRKLAGALGRAVGPMPLLDVTNRPLGNDHLTRGSAVGIGPVLRASTANAGQNHPDQDPYRAWKRLENAGKSPCPHLLAQLLDCQSGILSSEDIGACYHNIRAAFTGDRGGI